jgi:hypothetical protein
MYPFRDSTYKQLAVSDLPVTFQQAVLKCYLHEGQGYSQSLGCVIEIVYACPEEFSQFV